TGQVPNNPCSRCGGTGVAKETEDVTVNIPAGVSDSEMIRVRGKGEAVPGGQPGDLYIKLHVTNDTQFQKDGQNLITDMSVSLTEAALGTKNTFATLDGSEITVKIPAGISDGEKLRIRDRGVPNKRDNRGDLLITINIDTPNNLTDEQQELLKQLQETGL
ncbi:MAG: DnaJ C-terminal domain-containing protein, partial [Candidatus Paceibacteria bacterium]